MMLKHCDHCEAIIRRKNIIVDIRIGNFVDTADLCDTCLGELMHITESFLNGDVFVRSDDR